MKRNGCIASFDCVYPEGNIRFQRVGVPRPKTLTIVVGFIRGPSLPFSNTSPVKRVLIEVGEIQYLSSLPPPTPVSVKG